MTYIINANELEAISLSASHEATHCYLNGVFFEVYKDNSIALIATDGHRMASLRVKADQSPVESFILGNDDIKKILSMVKLEQKNQGKFLKNLVKISITTSNNELVIACILTDKDGAETFKTLGQFTTKAVDGNFPDYRRIIPVESNEPVDGHLSFNMIYMTDFGTMNRLLSESRSETVIIKSNGKESPIRITLPASADFLGVLMPVRC